MVEVCAISPPVAFFFCPRGYVRSSTEGEVEEGFRGKQTQGKQSPRSSPVELGQWLSAFNAHQQHLEVLSKQRLAPPQSF